MLKMPWRRTLIFRPTFFASSCESGQRAGGKCGAKNGDKLLSCTALTVWPNRHNCCWDDITTAGCLLGVKLSLKISR